MKYIPWLNLIAYRHNVKPNRSIGNAYKLRIEMKQRTRTRMRLRMRWSDLDEQYKLNEKHLIKNTHTHTHNVVYSGGKIHQNTIARTSRTCTHIHVLKTLKKICLVAFLRQRKIKNASSNKICVHLTLTLAAFSCNAWHIIHNAEMYTPEWNV